MKHFADLVKSAKSIYGNDLVLKTNNIDGDVRVQYMDQSHFENIARQFGIFEEWKVYHISMSINFVLFLFFDVVIILLNINNNSFFILHLGWYTKDCI